MQNISVTALGTTISINSQTTKTFTTYTKTLVQFHRWNSTPPQFIYLDLHGSAPGGARVLAHMIVYGVKGYVPNVDSSVYDAAFVIENGKMLTETDININGHTVMNLRNPTSSSDCSNKEYVDTAIQNTKSRFFISCFYNRSINIKQAPFFWKYGGVIYSIQFHP